MTRSPLLDIQNLSAGYGDRLALEGVSLNVRPGEVLAVTGPNGAGKSTLIRAASGVLPRRGGRVLLDGQDVQRLSILQRSRLLAVVPQARNLPGDFSVYQTVMLGRTPHLNWLGQTTEADHIQVLRALQQTNLEDLAERPVGKLSGGEQQRVLLARALAQDTPLLFLDEPTTHLDLQHQSALLNLARRLARERGLAILMVLHELNQASIYSDRVALLVEGKVRALGEPQQVFTAERLSAVYHVPVHVIPHPEYGKPLILPDGLRQPSVMPSGDRLR